MKKLEQILNLHGVIFIENSGRFECHVYSGDNIFDTLEVIGGQLYINGQPGNLLDWLGY